MLEKQHTIVLKKVYLCINDLKLFSYTNFLFLIDWCKKGGLNASVDLSKSMSKSKPLNTSKVSTSLNMGKNFDKTPLFTKITGKTANERLYNRYVTIIIIVIPLSLSSLSSLLS